MILSKREKTILVIVGICSFLFIYYQFVAEPLIKGTSSAKANLEVNKQKLNNLKLSEANIEKIKKQVEDLTLQAQHAEKSIPDSSKVPEIIIELKNMVDSSGCTAGKLTFGLPVIKGSETENAPGSQTSNKSNTDNRKTSEIVLLPIGYQVSGDYSSIVFLLNKIENNSRKMVIEKIAVNKNQDSGTLTANISMSCFYLQNGNPVQPIEYPFVVDTSGKTNIFN